MSNAQKNPLSRTLTIYINQLIQRFLDQVAKGRPATVVSLDPSGTIVTVNFEIAGVTLPQVTMPMAGSEYIRFPIQPGCKGVCLPADFYLGAMSGLGTGTADTTPRGNLSTLVFFPIGNKNFSATDDAQSVVIYGPNGVILRDSGKKTTVTLTPAGVDINAQHNVTVEADTKIQATVGANSVLINTTEIVLTVGAATLTMTASGIVSTVPITAPDVTATAAVVAGTSLKVAGKEMSGHIHDVVGVQAGASTLPTTPPI